MMCSPQFIYKYMSFDKFIAMVEKQKMYLTRIDHWDDTFEGYLLSHYLTHDGRFSFVPQHQRNAIKELILKSIYAQSWTHESQESDAMWRIYSHDCKGVRIKCAFSETLNDIKNRINCKQYNVSNFAVDYSNSISVNAISTTPNILENISDGGLVKYALEYKRPAFKHEAEYRFCAYLIQNIKVICDYLMKLYHNGAFSDIPATESHLSHCGDVLEYQFALTDITEILLDPRASQDHRNTFDAYCTNRGFSKQYNISCNQSKLYRPV